MNRLILLVFIVFAVWLIRRDNALRNGFSGAVWIPTLWVGLLASRPLSTWLGFEGIRMDVESATAGSTVDMLGYLILIAAAIVVLTRRQLNWGEILQRNWPIFLFYGFFLLSVTWANHPFVSFKRWFKEFGNILIALVILTEIDPQQAFRAVFVRCGYVLIPLSVIFIRYFPDLGRRYNIHSGEIEPIGVTFQKNSLGTMVLVCGLVLLWDWFERFRPGSVRQKPLERFLPFGVLLIGVYLLYLCDSKTSIVCLMLAGCILTATRLPFLRQRLGILVKLGLAAVVGLLVLDQLFGIKEAVVGGLGRDMTFTGRTEVWHELLNAGTDPIFGTGFCSFWDDMGYQSKLPEWIAFSAHNGYLEIYIAGGGIGVFLLAVMLLKVGQRIRKALAWGGDYAVVRLAVYVVILIANFTESNFALMTPLGFLFLLIAFGSVRPERRPQTAPRFNYEKAEPRPLPMGSL